MSLAAGAPPPRPVPGAEAEVLLVGFPPGTAAGLRQVRPGLGRPRELAGEEALRQALAGGDLASGRVAVLALGPALAGEPAREALGEILAACPDPERLHLILAAGETPEIFSELVAAEKIFFLTRQPPPAAELAELVDGALARYRSRQRSRPEGEDGGARPAAPESGRQGRELAAALALARELAAVDDPEQAGLLAAEAVLGLLAAQGAELFLHDPEDEALWSPRRGPWEERESAATGLVGFVVRTGTGVRVEAVGGDARHDPEIDLPVGSISEGGGQSHFLAVPILTPAGEGDASDAGPEVVGVLTALRQGVREAFHEADRRALTTVASRIAPAIHALSLEVRARRHRAESNAGGEEIFRREALEHHLSGVGERGDLLRLSPAWAGWTYRLLLAVLTAALLYSIFGRVNEYATGPAVVRTGGRVELTAPEGGTVTRVAVASGETVDPGQVLVTFYDVRELAELERIDKELELQLVDRLRNPADPAAERALIALRAERDLAASRLEERSLRAPGPGVASDVRVRPGQHVLPGQILLTLRRDEEDLAIIALLPGQQRPRLAPGQVLRLELAGYRYAYQHLIVESVGDEVLAPGEARRALGPEVAETLPLAGPVVFVHARLPARTFRSDGDLYEYHEGMHGTAEVRVHSEPILVTLIPGLEALLR